MQPPGDIRKQNPPGTMGWMEALAIVILFATLGFGGLFWWPFFVGAVLVVCLAYWYYHHIRKVR
jgi:amino acid transporter